MKKLIVKNGLFLILVGLLATKSFAKELKYIGMPIGGICTGTVYLGGDGELWNWDIFNIANTYPGWNGGDRYYMNPMHKDKKFANGFAIKIKDGLKIYDRQLNSNGFSDIEFTGEYPVGKVSYKDSDMPVTVDLTAFSPFVPTDEDASGLPAIIMEYEVKNIKNNDLKIELSGWLQNMSCFQTAANSKGKHVNNVVSNENYTRVELFSEQTNEQNHADWGSMSITLLGDDAIGSAESLEEKGTRAYNIDKEKQKQKAEKPLGEILIGGVKKEVLLKSGETAKFRFIISWDFPNIHLWAKDHKWINRENLRHYYSKNFSNAAQVSDYVINNPELIENTLTWNKTWYDSSLPLDFLNRTFINTSTLATTASVRFDDLTDNEHNEGRFYNFEGVYLGHGTCRHVSHYGQALGRVFPKMARQLRSQVDLGLALSEEGVIGYRGEMSDFGHHDGRGYAADGQAGTILGVYREHLMAPDNKFLTENWEEVKKAMNYMITHDKENGKKADGILEGIQYNTLDRIWYGKISWISGLYVAALKASAEMADAVGDKRFAKECREIARLGGENMSEELFNGEYFIQKLDPNHMDAPNTNDGCHIDQLLGQFWASQLGLGYIVPQKEVKSSINSIIKYNFVENYDKFLETTPIPISRWYATGDEQGLIMCSFPKGGSDLAPGKINNDWEKLVVGYFSEMWTGQEHAIAAMMIDEGMNDKAFKIIDAINERYSAEKRNPYNEVEYGNHYTRAMSGYAPFISATGFHYNGTKKEIGFNPRVNLENFKSAFIASDSWGSYSQKLDAQKEIYTLDIEYGKLPLNKFIVPTKLEKPTDIDVKINNMPIEANFTDGTLILDSTSLNKGDNITITLKK